MGLSSPPGVIIMRHFDINDGVAMRLDFIDISHWNEAIDWPALAASEVLGVIAKASQGTANVDCDYAGYRRDAFAAGLGFASYHYLEHGNVASQMAHYLATACPEPGERVVIDYEESDPPVTLGDLEEAVRYLKTYRPDLEITVYGASKLTEDVVNGDAAFLDDAETSLWAARYSTVNEPVIANPPWAYWSAWQYTDEGQVAGVEGDCDLNTFNGSRDACIEWFGNVSVPLPEPEPAVDVEPAIATVEAFGHVVQVAIEPHGGVVISVDDQPWTPPR
jgi:lysozyme